MAEIQEIMKKHPKAISNTQNLFGEIDLVESLILTSSGGKDHLESEWVLL